MGNGGGVIVIISLHGFSAKDELLHLEPLEQCQARRMLTFECYILLLVCILRAPQGRLTKEKASLRRYERNIVGREREMTWPGRRPGLAPRLCSCVPCPSLLV